jgi:Tfp pilus assembly protein FimT
MEDRKGRWKILKKRNQEIENYGRKIRKLQNNRKGNWFLEYDKQIKSFFHKVVKMVKEFEDKDIKIDDMGYSLVITYNNNHIRFDHNGLSLAGNGRVKVTSNKFLEKEIIFSGGREWVIDVTGHRRNGTKLLDEKLQEKYLTSALI